MAVAIRLNPHYPVLGWPDSPANTSHSCLLRNLLLLWLQSPWGIEICVPEGTKLSNARLIKLKLKYVFFSVTFVLVHKAGNNHYFYFSLNMLMFIQRLLTTRTELLRENRHDWHAIPINKTKNSDFHAITTFSNDIRICRFVMPTSITTNSMVKMWIRLIVGKRYISTAGGCHSHRLSSRSCDRKVKTLTTSFRRFDRWPHWFSGFDRWLRWISTVDRWLRARLRKYTEECIATPPLP